MAGHLVAATSVTVSDGTLSESCPVISSTDAAGRQISVVNLGAAATIAVDPAITYTVSWASPGAISLSSVGGAWGAGEILELMLAQSTLPVDFAAIRSAKDALNAYKIGAFIQQQLTPFEWVVRALLPVLPVSVLSGPNGWRVIPVPVSPTKNQCVATLYAGDGFTQCVRLGRVVREGYDEVSNEILVKYAASLDTSAAGKSYTLSGSSPDSTASARRSFGIYGRRERVVETVAIYDDSTAARIAGWMGTAYAYSRNKATYSLVPSLAWIEPGDLVWLVDTRLKVEVACWVQAVSRQLSGGLQVDLIWTEGYRATTTG